MAEMMQFPSANGISNTEKQLETPGARKLLNGESINDILTPQGLKILRLGLKGVLPPDLILTETTTERGFITFQIILKTIAAIKVTLDLTPSILDLSFDDPGIIILLEKAGLNISKTAINFIRFFFGHLPPEIHSSNASGTVDTHNAIVEGIISEYEQAFLSTAFVRAGYDWTKDQKLSNHLLQLYNLFTSSDTKNSKEHGVFTSNFVLHSIEASVLTLIPIRKLDNGSGIVIDAGSNITFTINLNAPLVNLLDAKEIDSVINLKSIEIACFIKVFNQGEVIGEISVLEITKQAQVLVKRFELIQPGLVKVDETINLGPVSLVVFLNGLVEMMRLASEFSNAGGTNALALSEDNITRATAQSIANIGRDTEKVKPNLIKGLVVKDLNEKLTVAIRELIKANLTSIPGFNLSHVFNVSDIK